ncbi:MAG: flagellar biosynthetic protein FliR [Candidatus Velthaea sp.]
MAGLGAFDLFGLSQVRFETLLLVLVRVSILLGLVPVFSGRQIPLLVRISLGLLISLIVARTVPTLPAALGLGELVMAVLSQMFIGLVFGFVAFLVFTGIQFAGEILDIQIGFAVVNIINPVTQQQVTIVGEFELALATLLYLVSDAYHYLLHGIAGSFALLPLPYATVAPILATSLVTFFTQALFLIFQIAAPVAIALFITNIALGLMARVAPQMNVFVVGFPLQIAIGLVMLIVSMPLLGNVLPAIFAETPRELDVVLREMAPPPTPLPTRSP